MNIKLVTWDENNFVEAARLLRQSMPGYPFPDFLFREKLTGDPEFDPNLIYTAFDGGTLTGFIMGVIRKRESGPSGYIKLIGVRPGLERRGIGTTLITVLETEFRKKGLSSVRVFESYPNYFMPGVDTNFPGAISFFEAHGYKKFNETSNMEVFLQPGGFPVEEDMKRLSERGVEIRRAGAEDKNKLTYWLNVTFPEWKGEVAEAFKNDPVSLYIALKEGRVIGFSGYEANNRGIGWFGPMGTDITFRGLSIGRVLLRLCLNNLQKDGFARAIIPWVGPVTFYKEHAGARIDKIFWRYEKKLN